MNWKQSDTSPTWLLYHEGSIVGSVKENGQMYQGCYMDGKDAVILTLKDYTLPNAQARVEKKVREVMMRE